MPLPIYTAFFTVGTLYEAEAARLRRSLDRLGLPHDIRGVADLGSWVLNSRYTAQHMCDMLAAYPDRPVVQLDADAVVWQRPVLFDDLPDVDIAAHYRRGNELLNGTVYMAPTPGAREVVWRYADLVRSHPDCANEQTMLDKALRELPAVRFRDLPAGYCWIHDLMADDLAANEIPVIEHLQASRETHVSAMTESRRRRLEEIKTWI